MPGKVYQASLFQWGSTALAEDKGYLPKDLYPDIQAKVIKNLSKDIGLLPVVNTPEITVSENGADFLFHRYGSCLENLEAYSVANILKHYHIPLTAFLGVTNKVGELSHKQYLENREFAWETLGDTILNILLQHDNEI